MAVISDLNDRFIANMTCHQNDRFMKLTYIQDQNNQYQNDCYKMIIFIEFIDNGHFGQNGLKHILDFNPTFLEINRVPEIALREILR